MIAKSSPRISDAIDRHITGNWGEDQFLYGEDDINYEQCFKCAYDVTHLWHDNGQLNEADADLYKEGGKLTGPQPREIDGGPDI